jgi:hypothetical protein
MPGSGLDISRKNGESEKLFVKAATKNMPLEDVTKHMKERAFSFLFLPQGLKKPRSYPATLCDRA